MIFNIFFLFQGNCGQFTATAEGDASLSLPPGDPITHTVSQGGRQRSENDAEWEIDLLRRRQPQPVSVCCLFEFQVQIMTQAERRMA